MDEQLTAQQEREYVEAAWEWSQIRPAQPYEGVKQDEWIARLPLLPFSQIGFVGEQEAIHAAYLYTKERERQIAEAEEEVDSAQSDVRWFLMGGGLDDAKQEIIHRRMLAHAVARLADLKRGLR